MFYKNNFSFIQQTQYKPNVLLNIDNLAPTQIAQLNLNLYRSLTDVEKASITHNDPTYSDLCRSLCYVKIKPTATSLNQADFACDTSNPEIKILLELSVDIIIMT